MKVLLVGTNFGGLGKKSELEDSWIRFDFPTLPYKQMGNFPFVGNQISLLSKPTKIMKISTPHKQKYLHSNTLQQVR